MVLLGGSAYGVARVGRGSTSPGFGAADIDDFAISDSLLDNARGGAAVARGAAGSARQRQQQRTSGQQRHHSHHALHEEAHDRRAALEQQQEQHVVAATQQEHAGAAAGHGGSELTQEQLEQQHLLELQHLEQQHALAQQHALTGAAGAAAADPSGSGGQPDDTAVAAHVAAHIAAQQALPQREGPSLYSANLSGGLFLQGRGALLTPSRHRARLQSAPTGRCACLCCRQQQGRADCPCQHASKCSAPPLCPGCSGGHPRAHSVHREPHGQGDAGGERRLALRLHGWVGSAAAWVLELCCLAPGWLGPSLVGPHGQPQPC